MEKRLYIFHRSPDAKKTKGNKWENEFDEEKGQKWNRFIALMELNRKKAD